MANAGAGSNASVYSPVVNGTNGAVNDDFLYSLLVTNNWGCTNQTSGINDRHIYVYPFPVPSLTTPVVGRQGQYGITANNGNGGQLLCHGKVVFGNTSTIPNGTIVNYIWNFGDGAPTENTVDLSNIKHEYPVNYTMNWFDPGFPNTRYSVALTAVSNLGCSTTFAVNKDIKNGPDAIIGLTGATTQPLLSNSYLFSNLSQNRHPSFIDSSLWTWGDGTLTTNTTFIPKVYTAAGGYRTHLITYTGTGCTDTAYLDLTVSSPVAASFTTTPNTCGSKVVGFTNTSSGATTYSWDFGDGSPVATTANASRTYAADGAYTVILTINGAIASAPQIIYVVSNPVVGAIANAGASSCGNMYSFSNVSTGVNLSYAWTFGGAASTGATSTTSSASRTYSAAAAATVDLIVSADGRCPISATQLAFTSVIGGGSPVAGVTILAASVPSTTSKSVNNTSTNGTLYYVSLDGAAFVVKSIFPYDIIGLANGAHTVRLVASDLIGTCKDTATANFTITTISCIAVANFDITPSSTQPLATNRFDFFNTTTHNGFGWVTSYSWDFGNGTVDTINTFTYGKTYASTGSYNVTLTAVSSTGCSSTVTKVVTVTPSATAAFTFTQPACGVLAVPFNSSSSVSASTYSWNFGDGSPLVTTANPTRTYAAAGSYNVVLTINGSVVSATQVVVVGEAPTAAIITPTLNLCGNVHTYTGAATGAGVTYGWSFSNPNGTGAITGSAVTRTYSASGSENVILTATSGLCNSTATLNSFNVLQVGTVVDAILTVTASNACNETRTIGKSTSVGTVYEVSVDGGAYATQVTFPYNITGLAIGSHSISLKASTGLCFDIDTKTFIVGSLTAAFTSSSSSCGPIVAFTNTTTSTFGTPTHSWNFSSGEGSSILTSPSYTFLSAGTKTVVLTTTLPNGCISTSTNAAIVANPGSGSIAASFTSLMVVSGPCNTGVQFTSTSTGATSHVWNYGDGTVSVPSTTTGIFHAYAATGTFVVTLTAYNACGNTSVATANVVVTATGNPVPEVSFSTDNATQCITGNRFDFFNRTQLNGWGWVPTYSWSFGDLTTDNVNSFIYGKVYAAAGTYTVTLTGTSNLGCTNSSSMTVTVSALPCSPRIYTPGVDRTDNNGGHLDNVSGAISPTGISKTAKDFSNDVSLYPNPNTGNFSLGFKDLTSNSLNIVIIDMLGREVYINDFMLNGKKELDFNELNLSAGTYSLILKGAADTFARKNFVVINR